MRTMAFGLAERGWTVEILTTSALDHYTWANDVPAGSRVEDGLLVHRFDTLSYPTPAMRRLELAVQVGRPISLDEEYAWLSSRFTVPDLFQYMLERGHQYDALIFSPYLFWTATVCMPIVAERAVVMPCLHDEQYARLEVMRPVLAAPASVWFLSEPEHELAHRLGPVAPRHCVTGGGVDVPDGYDPEGFRERHGLRRPFALYAGRREPSKGWDWLLELFEDAVARRRTDLDLVTIGVGEITVPPGLAGRVIDLGRLSDADRDNALAAAAVYLQPSRLESFSRSVMEAWLAGTPVMAVADGAVVAWHCQHSGGGMTFSNADELADGLKLVTDHPVEAAALAARGRRYVLDNYTWPVVLDRMEQDLVAVITDRQAVGS